MAEPSAQWLRESRRRPGFRAAAALAENPASPGAPLAALVAEREKDYAVLAELRDADGPMLDRALDAVREFIVARGLILFGGLAIDCALRLKGARIYPDAQRPDYDFLSPRSVDDAYDLAEQLAAAGFVGVGAIRGIHVQTMKVRTDFRWVADVGHAPRDVFDAIPTFDYRGMRVVHPDFQRMDMHLAFCFPYGGAPREDVFHRWRKDLKRINLYELYYPVAAAGAVTMAARSRPVLAARLRDSDAISVSMPTARARLAVPVVAAAEDATALTVALHGFAAYAALRAALAARNIASAAPELALAFPDDCTVEVETPAGADAVVFASPWPAAAVAGMPAVWSDPYMDICPETVRAGQAVVYSTAGRLLAATTVRVSAMRVARVVTAQYLLLWLLYEAHRAATDPAPRGGAAATYRAYYGHTLTILRDAEAAASVSAAAAPDEGARRAVLDEFASGPFAPTTEVIGDTNTNSAYVINVASAAEKLREAPPPALGVPADALELIRGLPARGYYPGTGKPRPAFDYDTCPLFRRSGQPRPPL
jgi:hypothetical protein